VVDFRVQILDNVAHNMSVGSALAYMNIRQVG
jgi:hypothetical protein